jgi:hypothetical protein
VETLFAKTTGMDLADEREGAVELSVPGDRAHRRGGCTGKGRAGVDKRLWVSCSMPSPNITHVD